MERFSTYKKRKTQSTIINVIPIKIPTRYPVDIDRLLLKSVRKGKRPRIANTILKEKKKVRELSSLNFKTSYKAAAIETVQDSERQTRKSRIKSPVLTNEEDVYRRVRLTQLGSHQRWLQK